MDIITETKQSLRFWLKVVMYAAPPIIVAGMVYGGVVAYNNLTKPTCSPDPHPEIWSPIPDVYTLGCRNH